MTPLNAALLYASRGWSVFPIAGKVPITARGHLDATTDPAQITAWWTATPDASVAVSLRSSGLVALDIDPRNGGDSTFAELVRDLGEPPRRLHARSGSGGQHIVMADPDPGPDGWTRTQETGGSIRGKLGPGLDVKCNGYIVVEPSPGYQWLAFDDPPPMPPTWIEALRKPAAELSSEGVEAWREPSDPTLTPADTAALIAALDALGPGSQGKSTTYAAFATVFHAFGLGVDDGWPFIEHWNARRARPHSEAELIRQATRIAGQQFDGQRGHARPSLDPFDRIVRAGHQEVAAEKPPPDPFAQLVASAPPEDSWATELQRAYADLMNHRGTGQDQQAGKYGAPAFTAATDLFGRTFPPTPWLVQGLLTCEALAVLGAEPKTTKTWSLLEMAMSVATGTQAFGAFDVGAPGHVALFLAEDAEKSVRNRLRALAASRGMDPVKACERIYVICRKHLDLAVDADLAWVVASMRMLPRAPVMIGFDPFRDIHVGDENDSTAMAEILGRLRSIRDLTSAAVMFLHHTGKASQSQDKRRAGQRMRGSGAIHGAVDCGFYLSDLSGDSTTKWANDVEVEIKAARGAGRFSLELEVVDDTCGEAVSAKWNVLRGEERAKRAEEGERVERERVERELITAIHQAKLSKSWREIRDRVTGGAKLVQEVRDDLEFRGVIARNGSERTGKWYVVAAGAAANPDPALQKFKP